MPENAPITVDNPQEIIQKVANKEMNLDPKKVSEVVDKLADGKEAIRSTTRDSFEKAIAGIRQNPDRNKENALILQTYAVLFLDVKSQDIGGIDGRFGEKTWAILRKCQADDIGSLGKPQGVDTSTWDEILARKAREANTSSTGTEQVDSAARSGEKARSTVKIEGDKLIVTDTLKASGNKDKLPDLTGYYYDSENGIGVKVDDQGNITNLTKYGITGTYDKERQTATYKYRGKIYTQIEITYAPQVMPDGEGTRVSERQGLRAVDYDSRTKTASRYVNDLIQVKEDGEFKDNKLYTGEVSNIKTGEILETYQKGRLTYSNNPGTIVATMSKQ